MRETEGRRRYGERARHREKERERERQRDRPTARDSERQQEAVRDRERQRQGRIWGGSKAPKAPPGLQRGFLEPTVELVGKNF